MDFAVSWLVIIGPILIGVAGVIWYGSGPTPALWVGFAGTILLILAGTLQLQQAIWKSQASEPIQQPELGRAPALTAESPNLAPTSKRIGGSIVRATYVRLRIKNVGRATARHCSARLIKIERQNQKGSYTELPYTDTLDMAWSNKAEHESRISDIPAGSSDNLDIVFAIDGSDQLYLATIIFPNYPNLMRARGEYRFTMVVGAEEALPSTVQLRVHWGGGIEALSLPADPVSVQ